MTWTDALGLLADLLAKAKALKEYGSVPHRWSKRKGKDRWVWEGTLRKERAEP